MPGATNTEARATSSDAMAAWRPRFACPECRGGLAGDREGVTCAACGLSFEVRGGIHRFLTAERAERGRPFHTQYRLVREREGYRSTSGAYYRMLPSVARDSPHAAEWRLRRESYVHLQQHALPDVWSGPAKVLDLGAGNGWLSHRLSASGHSLVAVDRVDDDADGLGACLYYPVPLVIVQADFDALPFEERQFDLVVFDGSLHYAENPMTTLREAHRMLADGATLAVMDSPLFARGQEGHAMVAEQLRRLEQESGVSPPIRPGAGFLTFDGLEAAARSLGLQARFVPTRGSWRWRLGRRLAPARIGRSPAAFGVWVAR